MLGATLFSIEHTKEYWYLFCEYPPLPVICRVPVGSCDSPTLTWTHLDTPRLTWTHLDSLGFTWTHLDSLGLTWTHLDSFSGASLAPPWPTLGSFDSFGSAGAPFGCPLGPFWAPFGCALGPLWPSWGTCGIPLVRAPWVTLKLSSGFCWKLDVIFLGSVPCSWYCCSKSSLGWLSTSATNAHLAWPRPAKWCREPLLRPYVHTRRGLGLR